MKPILEAKKDTNNRRLALVIFVFFCLALTLFSYVYLNKDSKNKAASIDKTIPSPQFSHSSGFYTSDVLLEIRPISPSAKVYYTLDGSQPTVNSNEYERPIVIKSREEEPNKLSEIKNSPVFFYPLERVFKGTIVRAVAVLHDSLISNETVASFFIHPKGRERYSLPVFSLITNEDNFFGYKSGIYVNGATTDDKDYYLKNNIPIDDNKEGFPTNYKRRGARWERPVWLTFFDDSTNSGFTVKAGVRIHGNVTRERPQKSLRVLMTGVYGASSLNYPLFKSGSINKFYSFILRSSGQDMYNTMFRDGLMQQIIATSQTSLDLQRYRPSILFLNGEYWGIHNIRERFDPFYFFTKYRIPSDSLSLLGPPSKGEEVLRGKVRLDLVVENGSIDSYESLMQLLEFVSLNDMSVPENYSRVRKEIDIDNFIEYIIFQFYCANPDWLATNVKVWRYKFDNKKQIAGPKDGKWRWILYDTDRAFGREQSVSTNMLKSVTSRGGLGLFIKKLLENPNFRKKFYERMEYHINTSFEPSHVLSIINQMKMVIEPEMAEHIDRWRSLPSIQAWENEVKILKDFAKKRPAYLKKELLEFGQQYK